MLNTQQKLSHEKGVVIWILLLGISLLVVLGLAMSTSVSDSKDINKVTREKIRSYSSVLQTQSADLYSHTILEISVGKVLEAGNTPQNLINLDGSLNLAAYGIVINNPNYIIDSIEQPVWRFTRPSEKGSRFLFVYLPQRALELSNSPFAGENAVGNLGCFDRTLDLAEEADFAQVFSEDYALANHPESLTRPLPNVSCLDLRNTLGFLVYARRI